MIKTMSSSIYIANQVQACMKTCSYPATINKHLSCFQLKSNTKYLFAKKKRLSIRKHGTVQAPHCTISSSSDSGNDQDDNSFNLGALLRLLNGVDNETPSKSKDGDQPPWKSVLLPILLPYAHKKILLFMVSNVMDYIVKNIEVRIRPTDNAGIAVGLLYNIAEWKGISVSWHKTTIIHIPHGLQASMFLRNGRILLQPLEYLKLKIEEIIVALLEKTAPSVMHNGMAKAAFFCLLLSLFFMAISLILWIMKYSSV